MKDVCFITWSFPPALKFCFTLSSLNNLSSEVSRSLIWSILSTLIYQTSHINSHIQENNPHRRTFNSVKSLIICSPRRNYFFLKCNPPPSHFPGPTFLGFIDASLPHPAPVSRERHTPSILGLSVGRPGILMVLSPHWPTWQFYVCIDTSFGDLEW